MPLGDPCVLAVAHRAGNALDAYAAAVALGVDVVECDVHASRGRLELRHSKTLGPLPWLWDRQPWQLTSRRLPPLHLEDLLDQPGPTLMLDLKGAGGVGPRTARALQAQPRPVLVCGRWWPAVEAFAGLDGVRTVLSARNRSELLRLRRRLRRRSAPYGVSLHGSLLSAPVVAELRERVELVLTWGVDDLDRLARVTALGVNGVISDSAEVLRAVTGQRYERSSHSSGK